MGRALLTVRDPMGRIEQAIDLAISTAEDFRPLWRAWKPSWYQSRRRMAQTLGRSTGTPWPTYERTPERNQYKWIKAKITGADPDTLKPLHWENSKGRLLPSLYVQRHPFGVWRPKRDGVTMGTRVPYARNHNRGQGYSPRWRNLTRYRIPRRPLLRFGRVEKRELADAVAEFAGTIAAQATGKTRVGRTSAAVRRLLVMR